MEGTLVEKTGTKAGAYRIVNKEIEFMDFVNVSLEGGMDLVMPLGLHEKSIFFPKAVMVVAGVTGHGKTSLVLNIIKDNMNKFDFKYFISEMSPLALNYKLSLFGMPIENWKMQVIPDHAWDYSNIQDNVFHNSINVIDYLEPDGEKSYNIHEVISGIIKRLDKGMAIITTQKKKDVELSAGGIYTAKAASFYLSLDWGTLRIYKNRYREEDKNPQCSKIDFDLKPGVVFEATTEWYNPNSQFKPKQVKAERSYHEHEV
jgi:hypothetical protein